MDHLLEHTSYLSFNIEEALKGALQALKQAQDDLPPGIYEAVINVPIVLTISKPLDENEEKESVEEVNESQDRQSKNKDSHE